MLPSRIWAELTTTDFAQADMARQIAVLPLAATEQHGPHLPLGTDGFIMEGYLARVRELLPPEQPALFLPMLTIGCSLEHAHFPGTLSFDAAGALAHWGDLIAAVMRTGCRKVALINSHGGNSSLVELLAREARSNHDLLVVTSSWSRLGYPADCFEANELAHGIHGGQIETALMLHLRPDLVRLGALRDFPSTSETMAGAFAQLRAFGRPSGFGWAAEDLNPAGTVGRAAAATATLGEACVDYGARAFVALLEDISRFEPSFIRRRRTRRHAGSSRTG